MRYTLRQLSTVAMDTRHVLSEKFAKAEETDEHQIFLHNKIGIFESKHIRLLGQCRRDMCITAHYERFVARMFSVAMISGIVLIIII